MSWPLVRLSDVAQIDREGVAPTDIVGGTIYVGLEHIELGGRLLNVQPVANGDLASTKFRFTRNYVLYGKLRPYLAKIALPDFEGICSTDILPVLPGQTLDRNYLTYFLRQPSMVEYAAAQADGANLPRLSSKSLAQFELPLPPLEDQRRIAAILDAADALRVKRGATIAKLKFLEQSIFIEMFGDPAKNLKKWPIVRLGDLLSSANYGTSEKPSVEGATPILRMNNINYDGTLDLTDLKYIDFSKQDRERYQVRDGDILFNRTNSAELVGKTAVFRGDREMGFAGYLVRLRTNKQAVPDYVSCFLNSRYGKEKLRRMCKSIIGMANINAKEVQSIQIPKPPFPLQKTLPLALPLFGGFERSTTLR